MTGSQSASDLGTVRIALLSMVVGGFILAAVMIAISWGVARIDGEELLEERREILAGLEQEKQRVASEQEAADPWVTALVTNGAGNLPAIAGNLIEWMTTTFGHDYVYLIGESGQIIRGPAGSGALDPSEEILLSFTIAEIRNGLRTLAENRSNSDAEIASLRFLDIQKLANGDFAFISIRPIGLSTVPRRDVSGKELLIVSIKLVDASMLDAIAEHYGIGGLRLKGPEKSEATMALVNAEGHTVGLVAWSPDKPAFTLLWQTAPAWISVFCFGGACLVALLIWVRKTSMRLRASQAQTSFLALHDPLTGSANRVLFERMLREAVNYYSVAETKVLLISIDLDNFKDINDTLGHAAGDELIQQVARRLSAGLPEEATFARLGGDEFALVQPGIISEGQARWICQNLMRSFSNPFALAAGSITVSASFGAALEAGMSNSPAELMRKADIALYVAKGKGRARFELYCDEMDRVRRDRRTLEVDLRHALITEEGLFLAYQPIFDASSGCLLGAEALVRWTHPSRGQLAPDIFIGIAEESGAIDLLGLWVLRQAARFAALAHLPWIAVNVSPVQLRNPRLVEQVLGILQEEGLSPDRLEIEITEGVLLQNSTVVQTTLAKLREAGIKIAIDDFGTGYSSIGYLRTYSVDKLKIDRSYVNMLEGNPEMSSIVRAIVEMCHALGMTVTAEGVEDDAQRQVLKNLDCDQLQGFFLSRPVSSETMQALLAKLQSAA